MRMGRCPIIDVLAVVSNAWDGYRGKGRNWFGAAKLRRWCQVQKSRTSLTLEQLFLYLPGFDWLKLPTTHSCRCLFFFFIWFYLFNFFLSAGKLRKQISRTHFYSVRLGIYETHRAWVVLSLIPCPPRSFPSLAWPSEIWEITWANALCVSHGWRGQSHGIMWALLRGKVWVQEWSDRHLVLLEMSTPTVSHFHSHLTFVWGWRSLCKRHTWSV